MPDDYTFLVAYTMNGRAQQGEQLNSFLYCFNGRIKQAIDKHKARMCVNMIY